MLQLYKDKLAQVLIGWAIKLTLFEDVENFLYHAYYTQAANMVMYYDD